MDPALYKGTLAAATWREHCLCAYVEHDGDPGLPSAKKLIYDFEAQFLRDGPRRYRFIQGFNGDHWWQNGRLRFSITSPDIPFFGLCTSYLCKTIPIVYTSTGLETGTAPPQYFYGGEEIVGEVPDTLKDKFSQISSGRGVHLPRLHLGQFF
jgi:hypothetical protein